jgi:phage baseplate assembly protein W
MASWFDYPFHPDGRGRSALTGDDDHVRDLIHQVLFTAPGERVNRPDFGCGLKQLVFMPNSDVLATTTEFLIRGSLQRWLDTVIEVRNVTVNAYEERLEIDITYMTRSNGGIQQATFTPQGVV